MTTKTLTGDYGYNQYRYSGGDATAIDATNATWTVANTGSQTNLYPFLVENSNTGIDLYGATIDGTVSMKAEWLDIYNNSAAFMLRDTKQADIYDLRISDAWDGVRIAGASDGFDVSNVWVSNIRDDAFENDNPVSGTIRDSLFDGVFSGISLGHKNMSNATNEVLELDNVLIRAESYLFRGEMTHQSPFKMESKSPKLKITDSVIAIDDVNHIGQSRLKMAWDKTVESSGNVFLNLSDKPLPNDYPMPGKGWTVLQGQEARDYWEEARDGWIAAQDGDAAPDDGPGIDAGASLDDDGDAGISADSAPNRPDTDDAPTSSGNAAPSVSDATAPSVSDGDIFLSDAALSGKVVNVSGFKPGTDKIVLDASAFTSLTPAADGETRTLDAKFYETAARADDMDDYIMYKWKTGEVFYDADGRGPGKQVKVAQLDERLAMDHSDFVVTDKSASAPDSGDQDGAPDAPGDDVFVFDTMPGSDSDAATISGFTPGSDKIVLDSSVFTSLGDGSGGDPRTLDADFFEIAARADDMDDYIMYKWKTGEVFYDADGRGPEEQVKIAQLDQRMAMDHSDFLIV